MRRTGIIAIVVVGVLSVSLLGGCSYDEMNAELDMLTQELAQVEDSETAAKLAVKIAALQEKINSSRDMLAKASSFLGIGETVLTMLGGVIPGVGLMVPFIRAGRRRLDVMAGQQEHVFTSVAAGGGVVNPEGAKSMLLQDPATYAAFVAWKEKAEEAKAAALAITGV